MTTRIEQRSLTSPEFYDLPEVVNRMYFISTGIANGLSLVYNQCMPSMLKYLAVEVFMANGNSKFPTQHIERIREALFELEEYGCINWMKPHESDN